MRRQRGTLENVHHNVPSFILPGPPEHWTLRVRPGSRPEGGTTTEPLIDDGPESILVAGRLGLALEQIWGHVCNVIRWRVYEWFGLQKVSTKIDPIGEQDRVISRHQHILRFKLVKCLPMIVRKLQSSRNLPDIRQQSGQWKTSVSGVQRAQRATDLAQHVFRRSQNQKRQQHLHASTGVFLRTRGDDPCNMRMLQANEGLHTSH